MLNTGNFDGVKFTAPCSPYRPTTTRACERWNIRSSLIPFSITPAHRYASCSLHRILPFPLHSRSLDFRPAQLRVPLRLHALATAGIARRCTVYYVSLILSHCDQFWKKTLIDKFKLCLHRKLRSALQHPDDTIHLFACNYSPILKKFRWWTQQ